MPRSTPIVLPKWRYSSASSALAGFTAAAREFRLTPSGVSKLVSRLEARLGSRLVNRSTRKLQLTAEGEAFYQRATRILSDLEEAEREASVGASPRGHLRVNTNIPVGMRLIVPLLPAFLEQKPRGHTRRCSHGHRRRPDAGARRP